MDRHKAREQLLLRRERLRKRLNRIRSDRRRSGQPLSRDFADQAIQRQNDEALDFLNQRTRDDLAEIERALERVDEMTYGICEKCGNAISALRLDLRPSTSMCAFCAVYDELAHTETR